MLLGTLLRGGGTIEGGAGGVCFKTTRGLNCVLVLRYRDCEFPTVVARHCSTA